ncbi:MAG: septum formation initiator family protein [Cytophagales bacterium]|nr:septum formation initiator family protein [Cytophagales bacterium]
MQWPKKLPKIFKNFYFIVGILFFLWLLIFDSNDLFTQKKLSDKKEELEKSKEFYEDEILEVKNEREALLTDDEQLEKLAREKYLMQKDSEDVYVIVPEKE